MNTVSTTQIPVNISSTLLTKYTVAWTVTTTITTTTIIIIMIIKHK